MDIYSAISHLSNFIYHSGAQETVNSLQMSPYKLLNKISFIPMIKTTIHSIKRKKNAANIISIKVINEKNEEGIKSKINKKTSKNENFTEVNCGKK